MHSLFVWLELCIVRFFIVSSTAAATAHGGLIAPVYGGAIDVMVKCVCVDERGSPLSSYVAQSGSICNLHSYVYVYHCVRMWSVINVLIFEYTCIRNVQCVLLCQDNQSINSYGKFEVVRFVHHCISHEYTNTCILSHSFYFCKSHNIHTATYAHAHTHTHTPTHV